MTYRVIKRYQNPKEKQKEVNNFFIKKVRELTDDTIDEAFKLCYKEYGLYPNVYTIKIIRGLLNTRIQIDVSIKEGDLIYTKEDNDGL